MDLLFTSEIIYATPTSRGLDPALSEKNLVICRKNDLENGGKEKLSEILNAINWKVETNLEFLELQEKESVRLSSGLSKSTVKRIVISFGLSPMELELQSPLHYYTPITYENAIIVYSHPVQELMNNKQYKGSLWNAIKNFKA